MAGSGVFDLDAANNNNKWSCVTSCGPSGAASSSFDAGLLATTSDEHLSIASVPPSPAVPRPANDPESAAAVLDALKQAAHRRIAASPHRRNPPPFAPPMRA